MKPLLICLTGPDGSGKSTIAPLLAARLDARLGAGTTVVASVWDGLATSGLFASKSAVGTYLGQLDGPARALFILHAYYVSMKMAYARKPRAIVLDSYFYKYWVTERGFGTPVELLDGATCGFQRPNASFFLGVPLAERVARKGTRSAYECGPNGDFDSFQASLDAHWTECERAYGPWTKIAAFGKTPDTLADEIWKGIEPLLAKGGT